jgi:hypothetical protein
VGSLEGSLGKIIFGGFCGNCPGYHHSLNVATQDEGKVYYRTLDTAFRLRGFLIYRKTKTQFRLAKAEGHLCSSTRQRMLSQVDPRPIPTESAAFSSNCKL